MCVCVCVLNLEENKRLIPQEEKTEKGRKAKGRKKRERARGGDCIPVGIYIIDAAGISRLATR